MEKVPKVEDESLNSLVNAIPSFLLRSKADNTVKSYLRGLGYWRIWTKNFPEIDVLPVKESHLPFCMVLMILMGTSFPTLTQMCYGIRWAHKLTGYKDQGGISDMGIDGPTFVPKSGYFLLIWVKDCPQMLAFS